MFIQRNKVALQRKLLNMRYDIHNYTNALYVAILLKYLCNSKNSLQYWDIVEEDAIDEQWNKDILKDPITSGKRKPKPSQKTLHM